MVPSDNSDRKNLVNVSDVTLVVAVARWRQDALAEIYRRHASSVFGLSCRLLNNRSTAEEVVQEVFLRLWNSPEKYDSDRGSLRSFLLTQAHGRSVDLLRSESARRRREDNDNRRQPVVARTTDDEVLDIVMAENIKDVLANLPEAERVAIEMAYFGGHTYQETAARLGEPEGTVKSRIRSGLKRMRMALPTTESYSQ